MFHALTLELAGWPPWATRVGGGVTRGILICQRVEQLGCSSSLVLTVAVGTHSPHSSASGAKEQGLGVFWGSQHTLSVCRAQHSVWHRDSTVPLTWNSFPETMEAPTLWSIFANIETLNHFIQQFVFAVAGNSLLQRHVGRSSLVPRMGSGLWPQALA